MNAAQIHLALNHLPVVLPLIAAPLLAIGLLRGSLDVQRVAWGLLFLAALTAWPVYLSGEPTESIVKNYPGVSRLAIHDHQQAALYTLIALQIVGLLALGRSLLASKKTVKVPRLVDFTLALLALIAFTLVARTGHLGGLIRHEEIQRGAYLQ